MIETIVHNSILNYCKRLKRQGVIVGSSADVVSDISTLVAESLLSTQQRKIYSMLTHEPIKTGLIAKYCNLSSKIVSAQLGQIKETSNLISHNKKGRLMYWYKNKNLKL